MLKEKGTLPVRGCVALWLVTCGVQSQNNKRHYDYDASVTTTVQVQQIVKFNDDDDDDDGR